MFELIRYPKLGGASPIVKSSKYLWLLKFYLFWLKPNNDFAYAILTKDEKGQNVRLIEKR